MIQVNIAEAKAHCSELIQKSLLGEEVSRDPVFDKYGVRRIW